MNADGSDPRELVATRNYGSQKCGCDVDLMVSPNGKTITYVRVRGDWGQNQALLSVKLDGTGLKRLTSRSFEVAIKHDWSPNGKLIVFTSPGDPVQEKSANLWVMRPDGSHPRALTHYTGGTSHAFAGSFSPDGKWIVFRMEDAKGITCPAFVRTVPAWMCSSRTSSYLNGRAHGGRLARRANGA